MKKHDLIGALVAVIGLLFLFTTCDDNISLEQDECAKTEEPRINAGAIVNVTVVTNDGSAVVDAYMKVTIYKGPCFGPAKGVFDFSGFTDENGKFKTTTVYYNLDNSEDQVVVKVTITGTGKTEWEYYGYSAFQDGQTADLYVKIYDN